MLENTLLRVFRRIATALVLVLIAAMPAPAQDNPSGLKLPRFVSTRSEPINVRVGPGTRYDIAWVFKIAGLPVEIIQEFDVWRKIRYVDGAEGWIHQNLLTARRAGLVKTTSGAGRTALHARADDASTIRAWLADGFLVGIDSCKQSWCAVSVEPGDNVPAMSGFVFQFDLWGVYPDESFD